MFETPPCYGGATRRDITSPKVTDRGSFNQFVAAMVHLLVGSVLRVLESRKLGASIFIPPHHLRAPSPAAHHEKQQCNCKVCVAPCHILNTCEIDTNCVHTPEALNIFRAAAIMMLAHSNILSPDALLHDTRLRQSVGQCLALRLQGQLLGCELVFLPGHVKIVSNGDKIFCSLALLSCVGVGCGCAKPHRVIPCSAS